MAAAFTVDLSWLRRRHPGVSQKGSAEWKPASKLLSTFAKGGPTPVCGAVNTTFDRWVDPEHPDWTTVAKEATCDNRVPGHADHCGIHGGPGADGQVRRVDQCLLTDAQYEVALSLASSHGDEMDLWELIDAAKRLA